MADPDWKGMMNMDTKVEKIIARATRIANQQIAARNKADEKQKREKERAELAALKAIMNGIRAILPKQIRAYVEPMDAHDHKNTCNWDQDGVLLTIPGLAPIAAIVAYDQNRNEKAAQKIYKPESLSYIIAGPYEGSNEQDERIAVWTFYYEHRSETVDAKKKYALEAVLFHAQHAATRFVELQANIESRKAQRQKQADRKQAQAEAEREEQTALFNLLQQDPVGMMLLKAFLIIRDERSGFESQVENYEYSMSSIESRYSQRLAETKRAAEDATRQADDERRRARDLEDDLDAAKKKARLNA